MKVFWVISLQDTNKGCFMLINDLQLDSLITIVQTCCLPDKSSLFPCTFYLFHPFIFCTTYTMQGWVVPEPIPGTWRTRSGDTLDSVPTQLQSLTHSHTVENLEMSMMHVFWHTCSYLLHNTSCFSQIINIYAAN